MLQLLVQRAEFTDKSTIGQLLKNDRFYCYTLEDPDRYLEDNPDAKIPGNTAIPRGVYEIGLRYSPHFKTEVPWLKDVPGYEWVLIHWGNKPEDTEGCILVGDMYTTDWISHSRATFERLFRDIKAAIDAGERVTLEVT